MNFVETHCHLDDTAFANDLPEVLESATSAGITHFINIGYEPESWIRSLELARTFPQISYALGMHPNSADRWTSNTSSELESLLLNERAVAIGETGLDFFREHADHDAQRQAFHDQLLLGRRFGLPIIIHMRGQVEDEIISILTDFPDLKTVFHSFDGSTRLRDFIIERGDTIGVGGLMTRAGSVALREVLRTVPLESIVLETDSPYLVPRGVKDRRNTPAAIPRIASELAELLDRPLELVARQTTENAQRIFGLPTSTQDH